MKKENHGKGKGCKKFLLNIFILFILSEHIKFQLYEGAGWYVPMREGACLLGTVLMP